MVVNPLTIVSFRTFVDAGAARPVPPLAPLAGQYNISAPQLCAELNAATSKFAKGLPVPVYVVKSATYPQGFKAIVKPPTMSLLLTIMFYTESTAGSLDRLEGLSPRELYDIARVYSSFCDVDLRVGACALFSHLNSIAVVELSSD